MNKFGSKPILIHHIRSVPSVRNIIKTFLKNIRHVDPLVWLYLLFKNATVNLP